MIIFENLTDHIAQRNEENYRLLCAIIIFVRIQCVYAVVNNGTLSLNRIDLIEN